MACDWRQGLRMPYWASVTASSRSSATGVNAGEQSNSPSPETVHTVDSPVYYSTTLTVDDERWVVFSTAMEAGGDSTDPEERSVEPGPAVIASSSSDFTDCY